MAKNLINSGIIDPKSLPKEEIKQQVAKALNISTNRLEKVECWSNSIWVNISGKGGKFVSYRCLPMWIDCGLAAIENCQNRSQLEELGEIFRNEVEKYQQHYAPEALENLRKAWGERAKFLQEEEQRLQPLREHQQGGRDWVQAVGKLLKDCDDLTCLQYLVQVMERQSKKYDDLPEVGKEVLEMWRQRWEELSAQSA